MNNYLRKIESLMVVAIVVCLILLYFVGQAQCEAKSISFEESNFSMFGGCMVKHQGKWLPLENIRGFGDEN